MNVAIYSLTRDRLEFTQHCFRTLWDKAGYPLDHYVLDNGSEDGSPAWLREQREAGRIHELVELPRNVGVSIGSNAMLGMIAQLGRYDLVGKVDNDCEVLTDGILEKLVACFRDQRRFAEKMALSPRVSGIINQPARIRRMGRGGFIVGVTGMIGGLFHLVPWEVYREWRYPEDLPLASGQDDAFCGWLTGHGVAVGYVEDLVVRHYLGTDAQALRYPEYFKRKWIEERTRPDGTAV